MESAPRNQVSNLENQIPHNGATNSQENQSNVPKKVQKISKTMETFENGFDFLKQAGQNLLIYQEETKNEALRLLIVPLFQGFKNMDQIVFDIKHAAKSNELFVDAFQIWEKKGKEAKKQFASFRDFDVVKKTMEQKRIQDKSYKQLQEEFDTLKNEHLKLQSRLQDKIEELEKERKNQKIMNAKLICGDLAFSTKNMIERIFGFPIANQQDLLKRVSELEDPIKKEKASRAGFDDPQKAGEIMDALQKLRIERLYFAHPSFINGPYDDEYFQKCFDLLRDSQIEKFVKLIRGIWQNLDFKKWEPYKDYTYFNHTDWKPEHKNN